MAYDKRDERDAKRDAAEILSASRTLRESLSGLSAGPAGRTNVTVKLVEPPEPREGTARIGPHEVIIIIDGATDHTDRLADQLGSQGCTCTSIPSGDPDDPDRSAQECDCSNAV
jgi:hypothetical protein